MLKKLIKLAHRLDALGQYDLADELDVICIEAAEEMMSIKDIIKLWDKESNELKPVETFLHGEDPGPVPDERLNPLFHGKKDVRNPDELSDEDLHGDYVATRVEDIGEHMDPRRDELVERMEHRKNKERR